MTKTELVFVPTSAMGHLLSTIEFAKLIVQTNPNISILFLIYHFGVNEPTKINTYIESQSREVDPNKITFITLPPLSNLPDPSDPYYFATVIKLQNPLVKKAVQDRQSKPAAFILDLMNVFMIDIANELHIPSYIYFTAGANFLHTMLHFQEVADQQGIVDVTVLTDDPETALDLPGFINPLPNKVLPWVFTDKDTIWPKRILDLARKFREAKGILVNSFTELEANTIKVLQIQENVPTIYPVGPILSLENRGDSKSSNNYNNDNSSLNINDEKSIIDWLDGQPKASVVFLCFGSMGTFNAEQVKEIADGLDRSGQRFLWSLRKPIQVGTFGALPSEDMIFDEALPEGFMDRTAHRGKIIPWAPQVVVLAHQAIGGFVSHCGWNSILESIWFGVPLATWPMYSEQQLNAFTLVKELGLGVEIKIDYKWDMKKRKGNYLVKAEEVEDGVRKLMSMNEDMKRKVREMSELSRKVLQTDNGSSRELLTRFIAEINQDISLT
ncbi:anthocyanidin 3-O-glucosyltransferase 2-like [Silene latifolia]|uniref:anthocyanidin 3-O-glucosyltransferase 2-like n=1 Tax=Silene latifolia TaxID=37657 RepID=UPI003D7778F3